MVQVLPSPEVDKDSGLNLVRRVWIARFDIETEIVVLADGYVTGGHRKVVSKELNHFRNY